MIFGRDVNQHEKQFSFVNITGNAFSTITDNLVEREYEVNVLAASAA
jgi:hypothetical protein